MSPKARKEAGRIRVRLVKGWAGKSGVQLRNLRALGLRRSGDSNELPDTPSVRGVVDVVQHLVEVEPIG